MKKVLAYFLIAPAFLIFALIVYTSTSLIPAKYFLADTSSIGPTTYYVAPDGDDTNAGTSSDSPWKSIAKANTVNLQPGDSILFKRGATYYGALTIKQSGNASAPITIGAYGDGSKPVISGFSTLSGWKSIGNNVYEASCTECGSKVNMVAINGVPQAMGRYPNADSANSGYLTYSKHSGSYTSVVDNSLINAAATITDPSLADSPDWTGAQLVVRKNHWVLDRGAITGQSGGTISYISPSQYTPMNNYGYFIQNSLKTLDEQGEWYYNPSSKVVDLYYGSDPSSALVQASSIDSVLAITARDYISIQDISIQGANINGIDVRAATGVQVSGVDISLSGQDGVFGNRVTNFSISNSNIANSNSDGIECAYMCNSTTISNNTIQNSGLLPGMGNDGSSSYLGVLVSGTNNTVASNTIRKTGYIGLRFYGDGAVIQGNTIDGFALVKDDGGGIYTGQGDGGNKKIINNIISNGIGANNGTVPYVYCGQATAVHGIYLDYGTNNVEISGNTISNSGSGIYISNSYNATIKNNTIRNNLVQLLMAHDVFDPIRNIIATGNTFTSSSDAELSVCALTSANDIAQFGAFSNNKYIHTTAGGGGFSTQYKDDSGTVKQLSTLSDWQSKFSLDDSSLFSNPNDVVDTPPPTTTTPTTTPDTTPAASTGGSGSAPVTTTVVSAPAAPVSFPQSIVNTVSNSISNLIPTLPTGTWTFIPVIKNIISPSHSAPVITPAAPVKSKGDKKSYTVAQADYLLNGVLIHSTTDFPDNWTLDTATLVDGEYTLNTKFYYTDGTTDSSTNTFTVYNEPTIIERVVSYVKGIFNK